VPLLASRPGLLRFQNDTAELFVITKIVYFLDYPFSERDYNRFGIEILKKNGFEVEVWNFAPFLRAQVHEQVRVPDPIKYQGYREFSSPDHASRAISSLGNSCFAISYLPYLFGDRRYMGVYRAISRANLRYAIIYTNPYPAASANGGHRYKSLITRVVDSGLRGFLPLIGRWCVRGMAASIPARWAGIKPAMLAVLGADDSLRGARAMYSQLFGPETKVLWTHHLDYDIYLAEKDKPAKTKRDIGVFLDEYMPFHPDYIYIGSEPPITAEEYYPQLCRFFDFIEKNYGVSVVIAAHPRSHYENLPDYFGGRRVLRGQTFRLVREAGFVMLNLSQAHNFAVMLGKPMILLTNNKLQARHGNLFQALSSWLDKKPVNLDNPVELNWGKELTIDQGVYARYTASFIKKPGTPEIPCWQIVADCVRNEIN
jgi:hypothetical protein